MEIIATIICPVSLQVTALGNINVPVATMSAGPDKMEFDALVRAVNGISTPVCS